MRAPRRALFALPLLGLLGACGQEAADPAPAAASATTYDLDGRPTAALARPAEAPHVALVLLDAAPPASPAAAALQALAAEGLSFQSAATASTEAWPSLASVLTSLLPHAHAVPPEGIVPAGYARMWTTGAEVFGQALGYETVALLPAAWPSGADPLLQGLRTLLRGDDPAAEIERWSASRRASDAPLLVVALLATQADPATGLASLRSRLASLEPRRPWRLVATALRGAPRSPSASVREALDPDALRVPLAIVGPGAAPGVRRGAVGLADLFPTLLALARVPPLSGVEGASFDALVGADGPGRPSLFEWEGAPRRRFYGVHAVDGVYGVVHDVTQGTVLEHLLEDGQDRADAEGRLPDRVYDAAFAAAVERARDRVWAGVRETNHLSQGGYETQAQVVTGERPPPLRTAQR